jgi:predicted ribosomally synthesized peptide with nif11-like leader
MSVERGAGFVELMKTEGVFRKRVAETESPEARLRILRYEGFYFSDEGLDLLKYEVRKSAISRTGYFCRKAYSKKMLSKVRLSPFSPSETSWSSTLTSVFSV